MAVKTKWTIDAGHSEVQFKVKHLAIANVSGTFQSFRGDVELDNEDFTNAKVFFVLDTASVDTNNAERDKHLKSDTFFNAEKYPTISFTGTLQQKDDDYVLLGDLTILETTRTVSFAVEHTGSGVGRFNDTRAGFEITGSINRKDFGLNFNLLTETGSLVVGERVKIFCTMELVQQ